MKTKLYTLLILSLLSILGAVKVEAGVFSRPTELYKGSTSYELAYGEYYVIKNHKTGEYLYYSDGKLTLTSVAPVFDDCNILLNNNYLVLVNWSQELRDIGTLSNVNDAVTDFVVDPEGNAGGVLAKSASVVASVTDADAVTYSFKYNSEYVMAYKGNLYSVESADLDYAKWEVTRMNEHTHSSLMCPEHWCNECQCFYNTSGLQSYGFNGDCYYTIDTDGYFAFFPKNDKKGTVTTTASTLTDEEKAVIKSAGIGSNISGDMSSLFSGCSDLNSVEVNFTDWNNGVTRTDWLKDVATVGTLYCPKTLDTDNIQRGASTIPAGWNVKSFADPVKLTTDEYSQQKCQVLCGDEFKANVDRSVNGSAWIHYVIDGKVVGGDYYIKRGDYVCYRAKDVNETFNGDKMYYGTNGMRIIANDAAVEGDVTSLLNRNGTDELPDYAFKNLFYKSGIIDISKLRLPATKLGVGCYQGMFNCCLIETTPELPATKMAKNCYREMFTNCYFLKKAPELPATELAEGCYSSMFSFCFYYLDEMPELKATKLAKNCYNSMFYECFALNKVKPLPADTLVAGCYAHMFAKHPYTSSTMEMVEAPEIMATNIEADTCMAYMFYYAKNLNSIKVHFTDWAASKSATSNWVEQVASYGEFLCPSALAREYGTSRIPENWEALTNNPLCFTAKQNGSKVQLNLNTFGYENSYSEDMLELEYSLDGKNWSTYGFTGIEGDIISLNEGEKVYMRAVKSQTLTAGTQEYPYQFYMQGLIVASGDATTLMERTGTMTVNSKMQYLFKDCTSLLSAPELPATAVSYGCYYGMFKGCSTLQKAPELPATTLAENCYCYMFQDCGSLTDAPELPATKLDLNCYTGMFQGCTNLNHISVKFIDWEDVLGTWNWVANVADGGTFECLEELDQTLFDADHIPAGWTVRAKPLADPVCFTADEDGTIKLDENLDDISATFQYSTDGKTWSDYGNTKNSNGTVLSVSKGDKVYWRAKDTNSSGFFYGENPPITSLHFTTTGSFAVSGDITSLLYRYGTDEMPYNAFRSLFLFTDITSAKDLKLPVTKLSPYCYSYMFYGCSKLTDMPELPATELTENCYWDMFGDCTSLTKASLPAITKMETNSCWEMFYGCSSLNDVTVGFTEWPTASCATDSWMQGVASTGTFHAPNCLVAKDRDESHVPVGWVGDFTNGHEFAADDETKDVCTKCGHSFLRYTGERCVLDEYADIVSSEGSVVVNPTSGRLLDSDGNKLTIYSNSLDANNIGVIELNKPIVEIGGFGESAYWDGLHTSADLLTSITIPQTVEKISDYAFKNCRILDDIKNLHHSIKSVGKEAFCESKSVTFRSIPSFGKVNYGSWFALDDDSYVFTESADNMSCWGATYTRKNVPAGYSSYCLPFKADVSDKFSKVYTPVDVALVQDDDVCILFAENTSGNVDAQTPFVGYLASAGDVSISNVSYTYDMDVTSVKTTSISAFDYNGMDGALVENSDYSITWSGCYAKQSSIDGLKTMSETGDGAFADASETSPFRGFITANASANSDAKRFVGIFEGDDDIVTAVMDLRTSKVTPVEPQGIYTLDGKKVDGSMDSLSRGIYIVNGKKMVIK